MIVDLFAGPGGWDEGLRMLGHTGHVVGVEWDRDACRTAKAAGHARIRADVAALDPAMFSGATGLIASPPCQAWSMAGKRKGEQDRANCHRLADRFAAGDYSLDWTTWEDDRSPLVCQPVRWVRELHPEWVALEEVPAVASLWEHFGRIFRAWGYSVWTGDLCAADYGVPQTRTRRILLASRVRPVTAPEATHAEEETPTDLFGGPGRRRWVSMASALGWADGWMGDVRQSNGAVRHTSRPAPTITGAMDNGNFQFVAAGVTGEGRPKDPATQPADTLTGKGTAYWVTHQRRDSGPGAERDPRPVTEPSYTIRAAGSGMAPSGVEWVRGAPGSVRVTVEEAAVLQSFPRDYPWQGSTSKRYLQVGNAVPPLLAAHVLAEVMGVAAPRQQTTEAAA